MSSDSRKKDSRPRSAEEGLRDYIIRCQNDGHAPEDIRRSLLNTGWPEKLVDLAFMTAPPSPDMRRVGALANIAARSRSANCQATYAYFIGQGHRPEEVNLAIRIIEKRGRENEDKKTEKRD